MSGHAERNRLIEENLPLAGYLAREVHSRATHVPQEELAAVGALALVTAAAAFDPTLGVPFGAYARRRILGAFADEMRSMDWATRGIRKRIKEVTAVRDTLTAALGRTATPDEIATAAGLPRETVLESLDDAARTVTSLDDASVLAVPSDIALPEESATLRERREILTRAVAALPDRMRAIIQAVYIDERPVKQIAEELGVSHSAVSQQRAEAVRLLRDAMERFHLDGDAAPTSRVSETTRDAYFSRIGSPSATRVPARV
ncbi:sigma-70 family RNA polymerase sigma factor [Microbacterium sp. zg.Y1090]|uniref:sigma-70 family RNA polymerase sigma factor n=1 Tax=Microbacterium TaxID=33882 RepID=UPI00214B822A|nr:MULTISPECIES: sigma-70 family RNA polymerase sigma factor [unclassified Microbacterium]MCR2813971.1 sigma-70 family RNA polymerase sigma factor [Microbacterium sp. zg.Y1084]MCR2819245.1 sigma-70 family RNA polymerase sigma factor [Microbacterium sp. zg.Y1090]MDL5487162.1 sigma-70 family RNA polymerase sigma factor [Microbacterium sp. zg-Y1211]WIM28227.1 sigma-70 family RNA polymerase sigma factor [Microbacterium sp. zg-Y1090]